MRAHSAENPFLPPQRIGRYQVLLRIASGGMATVYLARSRGIGGFERDVAIKLSHGSDHVDFATELLEEAKLASRLRHPNVVPVLDVGESPVGVFLVMEYVPGDSLSGLARLARSAGEPLGRRIAMRILLDAMAGLHAAHELVDDAGAPLGLVHRDFTPHNILVGTDGVARLTDFGIAKAASRLQHTRTGDVKGKARYMSPEQARGLPLDRRCDVWAAAVVAWEILSGRTMFAGDNELAIMLKITTEPIPLLSEACPEIGAALDDALSAALARNAEDRCPTLHELAHGLRAACARAGLEIAEVDEVATHVRRLVGPRLAERAEHVAEVLAAQERMVEIDAVVAATLEPTRGTSSAPLAMPVALERTPRSVPEPPVDSETDSTSVTDRMPVRARRLASGVAMAIAALAVAVVVWRVGAGPRAPETTAPPSAAPPTVAAAPSSSAAPATPLAVIADTAVVEIRIGSRSIPVSPPADAVVVQRMEGERDAPVEISAVGLDGRTASGVASPDATVLRIVFQGRAAARPDPPARPKGTAPAAPQLAPNPF